MAEYRRWYQPGGTYFFTVVTYRRQSLFKSPLARKLLREAIRKVQEELYFEVVAQVLLYDHLHTLWNLPSGDSDFSTRWKRIKSEFTQKWINAGGREGTVTRSQFHRGHRGVWQRRFWEHLIRDEQDFENHCDYIHWNPVKHNYVKTPKDWPFSTFQKFVKSGDYPERWGGSEPVNIRGLDFE